MEDIVTLDQVRVVLVRRVVTVTVETSLYRFFVDKDRKRVVSFSALYRDTVNVGCQR